MYVRLCEPFENAIWYIQIFLCRNLKFASVKQLIRLAHVIYHCLVGEAILPTYIFHCGPVAIAGVTQHAQMF